MQSELYKVVGRDEKCILKNVDLLVYFFPPREPSDARPGLLLSAASPACLASLAQGLHEQRYYEAALNNRSFCPPHPAPSPPTPLATEGQGNGGKGGAHAQIRARE